LAELDEAVAKATSIRTEERAKNSQVIKESQEAQVAVGNALKVLQDFYAKAAESTSFAQARKAETQHKAEPEVFGDEPYQGMGAASGGVVGMIEVIQSDFSRLEAETTAAEEEAANEFKTFTTDSKVDKAAKSMDLEHKTSNKQNQESSLQEKKKDLHGTQKELTAALVVYEKLKPTCIETGVSYDDRVARRKEEIDSLQTALRILNNEDV